MATAIKSGIEAIGKPSKKVPVPATLVPALAQPDPNKVYGWNVMSDCTDSDAVLEHTSKLDYVALLVARTHEGDWVGGYLCRTAMGTLAASSCSLKGARFSKPDGAAQWAAGRILSLAEAQKLTPNALRKLQALVGIPQASPPPIEGKPDLPWLDNKGQRLAKGDSVQVPGSSYAGRTGCITCLDPALTADVSPAVWVDFPATESDTKVSDIFLPADVVRVEVPAEPVKLSTQAWDLLEVMGSVAIPQQLYSKQAQPLAAELLEAGFIEKVAGESGYQLTDAGRAALPTDDVAPGAAAPVAAALLAEFRNIPLEEIAVTRNTRQIFDDTALAELAQSIKERGVIAPITVRPHLIGGVISTYELVAGERRLRASKLAGLDTIPAMVRVLDDRAFIEVQLLENLQRQDVRPSDEAQAFAELLNKHKFSAEEIALKVGKPVKFVLQRAKLVTLIPFWMELLEAERLPLVAAHELARLPPHSQVVVKKSFENSWEIQNGGPLSPGTIQNAIQREVMRKLISAAFPTDDATLCPGVGACGTCPKNSFNHRGLFDEEANDEAEAKCLDSACFAEKKAAHLERRLKEVAGTDTLLISSSYDNPPVGALGYKFYDRSKEEENGAVLALMVDGLDAGIMRWVKVSNSSPNAEAVAQDKKAKRNAEIQAGKVSEKFRQLLTGRIYTTALANNRVLESHLDKQLYSELRSQGGPHTVLRFALVEQMGWEMPEGGEAVLKKLTPASNYQALGAWQSKNVSRLSYDEKLALYFALLAYNCSTFDSSNERLQQYAKAAGADTAALKKTAADLVEKKGPKA